MGLKKLVAVGSLFVGCASGPTMILLVHPNTSVRAASSIAIHTRSPLWKIKGESRIAPSSTRPWDLYVLRLESGTEGESSLTTQRLNDRVQMEVFVTIPFPIHYGLLGRCGRESWQFELLRSGLFSKATDGEDIVVIACSPDEANAIVTWATQYYPDDMTCDHNQR